MTTETNENAIDLTATPTATTPKRKRKLGQYVAMTLAEVTAQQLQNSVLKDLQVLIADEGDNEQTYVILREVARVRVSRKTKTALVPVK